MSDKILELDSNVMAAKAADGAVTKKEATLTLSSGAVVTITPPKTRVLYKLYMENPAPRPPKATVELGGKLVEQENPDDPDFAVTKQEYALRMFDASTKLIILTSLNIDSLPEGLADFDSDTEWILEMEAIGFESKKYDNRKARYLEWFFYRVAPDQEDINAINTASNELQGVDEEQVEAAAGSTFQDAN